MIAGKTGSLLLVDNSVREYDFIDPDLEPGYPASFQSYHIDNLSVRRICSLFRIFFYTYQLLGVFQTKLIVFSHLGIILY